MADRASVAPGLALAALLAATPAAAAPFDQYQLIMWQEHSPAENAALARLGVTAIKLRATGGEVDPAELAAAKASLLPFYLENIATDLYSTYHRYTPGRSVTWRFDAVKARRRADPTDPAVFVREPSLSDPAAAASVAERMRVLVRTLGPLHPLFYDLADEAGIGDLSAAWDADVSPASLAGFREWLHTQYSDLPALNAEWGTQFETWDAVQPELTDAALARGDQNFSAWGDFKAWMDVAFARAVRAGADALHAAAPDALAGLEGAQVPGWGGYDYAALAPSVDVMEVYDTGDSAVLAMAANPALKLLRTSFGAGDEAEAWRSLLEGGRGTIIWDEGGHTVIQADGTPTERGRALAALTGALRQVAPSLFPSRPDPDPVAVLVSQASFRVQWLLDRAGTGAAWSERDSGRENEDNPWRAARREMLQRLHGIGIEPALLATPQLEAGALDPARFRVVLLPDAIALSEREVAALRAFAASGGKVLADREPGLFDGHGKRRTTPPLAGVAQVPEALYRTGTVPNEATLEATALILAQAGVQPRATPRLADGARAPGVELRWRRDPSQQILSLETITPGLSPGPITLTLSQVHSVSDLRAGTPPQRTDHLTFTLDPAAPTILVLKP